MPMGFGKKIQPACDSIGNYLCYLVSTVSSRCVFIPCRLVTGNSGMEIISTGHRLRSAFCVFIPCRRVTGNRVAWRLLVLVIV